MDSEMRDGMTRVEDSIARVEEELRRSCRSGEESLRELRGEIAACLDGWVKTLAVGAAVVTGIAVIRR
jgi:hypothetical protein